MLNVISKLELAKLAALMKRAPLSNDHFLIVEHYQHYYTPGYNNIHNQREETKINQINLSFARLRTG